MSAAIPGGRTDLENLIEKWRNARFTEPIVQWIGREYCADDLSALLTAAGSAPVTTHGHHFSDTTWAGQLVREGEEIAPSRAGQAQPPKRCPRCDSPSPELHPSVQWEGEVQPCSDPWHSPAAALPGRAQASPESEDGCPQHPDQTLILMCPQCITEQQTDENTCPHCGKALTFNEWNGSVCPHCDWILAEQTERQPVVNLMDALRSALKPKS